MSYARLRLRECVRLTSRGANPLLIRQCSYGARPLSTMLSTTHRSFLQVPLASRNFSLWPSSKTSATPTPPPEGISAEKTNEGEEILSGPPLPEPTSNATTTIDISTIAEPPVTPEPASILDSATSVTDLLHNIPAPLQFGDFAALGIAGWTPAGLIRWSFEIINVASGLPWFWTIVVGSACWRLICVPLAIKASKAAAILQPHQQELAALQARMKQTTTSRNPVALVKANREMRAFYEKLGVSPLSGLVGLLQLPVTLGMFFAVKKMCDLPVEQLKYSGLEMFPDLTVADPTLLLPIAMTVAINVQLLASSRDVAPNFRPMLYFFHFLSIPGFFLLKGFPVGLILSIMTTGLLTTIQTLLLRIPHFRRAIGMPAYVPPPEGGKSVLEQLRGLLIKDGDIKVKVAQARREAMKKNLQGTAKQK